MFCFEEKRLGEGVEGVARRLGEVSIKEEREVNVRGKKRAVKRFLVVVTALPYICICVLYRSTHSYTLYIHIGIRNTGVCCFTDCAAVCWRQSLPLLFFFLRSQDFLCYRVYRETLRATLQSPPLEELYTTRVFAVLLCHLLPAPHRLSPTLRVPLL